MKVILIFRYFDILSFPQIMCTWLGGGVLGKTGPNKNAAQSKRRYPVLQIFTTLRTLRRTLKPQDLRLYSITPWHCQLLCTFVFHSQFSKLLYQNQKKAKTCEKCKEIHFLQIWKILERGKMGSWSRSMIQRTYWQNVLNCFIDKNVLNCFIDNQNLFFRGKWLSFGKEWRKMVLRG